jgi:hypothetical protein
MAVILTSLQCAITFVATTAPNHTKRCKITIILASKSASSECGFHSIWWICCHGAVLVDSFFGGFIAKLRQQRDLNRHANVAARMRLPVYKAQP